MRRNISLYIDGALADLDNASLILLNWTQEDLDNPTVVRNSYSRQVTLPGTPGNNAIFDHYFRLDRITGTGFDAMARTPFVIHNERNEILAEGYLKLDSVSSRGGAVHSYSVTLYGGLGGFFYGLKVDEDGNALNLGDLEYLNLNGLAFVPNASTTLMDLKSLTVAHCWDYMGTSTKHNDTPWANVIQFAPCYNGIPEDFDADKALVSQGQFHSILGTGSNSNYPFPGTDEYIVTSVPHDEWEMRDLRAYLQRPVLSINAFIYALYNRGGFSYSDGVESVLDMNGNGLWLTLPMPQRADDYGDYPVCNLFDGTMTPCDLLLGLAKTFGLVFRQSLDGVEMMTRDEWYAGGTDIDMTQRIDRADIKITPMAFDSRFYSWQNDVPGLNASQHEEKFGTVYGAKRVDTGYQFESSPKTVTDGISLKGAVQFLEASAYMKSVTYGQGIGGILVFPGAGVDKVTFVGYPQGGGEGADHDVTTTSVASGNIKHFYNADYPGYDVFDKPQFYGEDRKPEDGSGVLLYWRGIENLPALESPYSDYMRWHITDDDTTLFGILNEGVPCWDMRFSSGIRVTALPKFSRWDEDNNSILDFGNPREYYVPGATVAATGLGVYETRWRYYIGDRYDKDTTVLRCKADLSGLQVGQDLLRNFYWYGGAWWVLNKIENYSLTTSDLVQCEFVKVQYKDNYNNGQI